MLKEQFKIRRARQLTILRNQLILSLMIGACVLGVKHTCSAQIDNLMNHKLPQVLEEQGWDIGRFSA